VLAYTPLNIALAVPMCSTLEVIGFVLFTCLSAFCANHYFSAESGMYSSTASSASAARIASSSVGVASAGPVDVLMIPSGTGVIVVTTFPHLWD